MHPSSPVGYRREIHRWFATTPGKLVLRAEVERLNKTLPNLFGYHLVQVGHLCGTDMLSGTRIHSRTIVSLDEAQCSLPYERIRGAAGELPLASDTVDVLLLPHVLEFERRPHDALREAQRVLVPEGHVLISGFNPWSAMGLWRLVARHRGAMPWRGRFLSLNRVNDWLSLLGFDVVGVDGFFFRPPFANQHLMERLQLIERWAERLGRVPGSGAYLLVARKRVSTLTPIKPKWSARAKLVNVGLAEPTGRVARLSRCYPGVPRVAAPPRRYRASSRDPQ